MTVAEDMSVSEFEEADRSGSLTCVWVSCVGLCEWGGFERISYIACIEG